MTRHLGYKNESCLNSYFVGSSLCLVCAYITPHPASLLLPIRSHPGFITKLDDQAVLIYPITLRCFAFWSQLGVVRVWGINRHDLNHTSTKLWMILGQQNPFYGLSEAAYLPIRIRNRKHKADDLYDWYRFKSPREISRTSMRAWTNLSKYSVQLPLVYSQNSDEQYNSVDWEVHFKQSLRQ